MSQDNKQKEEKKSSEKNEDNKKETKIPPTIAAIVEMQKQQELLAKEMHQIIENAQRSGLAQIADSVRIANQSMAETMKHFQSVSASFIIPPALIQELLRFKTDIEATRSSMTIMLNPDLITRESIQRDIIPGLHAAIRGLGSQIKILEAIIKEKDEYIKQLEQRLDDKKKKDPDSSIV